MQQLTEIEQSIAILPISQRIALIENLVKSAKDEAIRQIEFEGASHTATFFQLLFLNSEITTLQSVINQNSKDEIPVVKGDKQINPRALFGIWADKQRNLEDIRQSNWLRNWERNDTL